MPDQPKQVASAAELIARVRATVERAGWRLSGSEIDASTGQVRLAADPKQEAERE